MSSAYSKSLFTQIDSQLDSWRVRSRGIAGARYSSAVPPPEPIARAMHMAEREREREHERRGNGEPAGNAASDASSGGTRGLTAADIAEIVSAQVGPLAKSLEAETRQREDLSATVDSLTQVLSDSRRAFAQQATELKSLKETLADQHINTRSLQEENALMRRRIADLERQQDNRDRDLGNYADNGVLSSDNASHGTRHGSGGNHGALAGAGGPSTDEARFATTRDILAVLNVVVGNNTDGTTRIGPGLSAMGDQGEIARSLRSELGALRDDLRAEMRFAFREMSRESASAQRSGPENHSHTAAQHATHPSTGTCASAAGSHMEFSDHNGGAAVTAQHQDPFPAGTGFATEEQHGHAVAMLQAGEFSRISRQSHDADISTGGGVVRSMYTRIRPLGEGSAEKQATRASDAALHHVDDRETATATSEGDRGSTSITTPSLDTSAAASRSAHSRSSGSANNVSVTDSSSVMHTTAATAHHQESMSYYGGTSPSALDAVARTVDARIALASRDVDDLQAQEDDGRENALAKERVERSRVQADERLERLDALEEQRQREASEQAAAVARMAAARSDLAARDASRDRDVAPMSHHPASDAEDPNGSGLDVLAALDARADELSREEDEMLRRPPAAAPEPLIDVPRPDWLQDSPNRSPSQRDASGDDREGSAPAEPNPSSPGPAASDSRGPASMGASSSSGGVDAEEPAVETGSSKADTSDTPAPQEANDAAARGTFSEQHMSVGDATTAGTEDAAGSDDDGDDDGIDLPGTGGTVSDAARVESTTTAENTSGPSSSHEGESHAAAPVPQSAAAAPSVAPQAVSEGLAMLPPDDTSSSASASPSTARSSRRTDAVAAAPTATAASHLDAFADAPPSQPISSPKKDGWGSSDDEDAAANAGPAARDDATDSSDDGGFGAPAPASRARGRGTNQLGSYAKRGGRGGTMLGFGMTSLAGAGSAGDTTGLPSTTQPALSQPMMTAGSDSDDDIGDAPAIGVLGGLRGRGGARLRGKTSARGGARLASLAKPADDSDDDW